MAINIPTRPYEYQRKLETILHVKFDLSKPRQIGFLILDGQKWANISGATRKRKGFKFDENKSENVSTWFWMQLSNNYNYLSR